MKKQLPSFLAGMLTMALIGMIAIPALASAGMTISVDPINIQINGQTFQPKDVNGKDVPVFAYSGTTYAPLRALAEAYGLEVGYDSKANMATVAEPGTTAAPTVDYSGWSKEDEAAYQEFKGYWDVGLGKQSSEIRVPMYNIVATLKDQEDTTAFAKAWNSMSDDRRIQFSTRLAEEYYAQLPPAVGGYYAWLKRPGGGWIAGVGRPSKLPNGDAFFDVQHHDF